MKRIQFFFKQYWPALLAGVMMGTSYIPFPPWAVAFCFAVLWVQVLRRSSSLKEAIFSGWWMQFLLSLIGFYWIAYVSHEYGYLPWPIALICLLFFASTVHTYIAVAAGLGWWIRKRANGSEALSLFAMASIVSLAETWWPSLFPWNLGYTLLGAGSPFDRWAQWADVVGFWGLSLILHQVNALVAYLFLYPRSKFAWSLAALVVIFSAFTFVYAPEHVEPWKVTDKKFEVLQVQANIGNLEKYFAERGAGFEMAIAQQYFDQTRSALQKFPNADLIIWPESAFPDYLDPWNQGRTHTQLLYSFLKEIEKPLLTGAYSSDPPGTLPRRDYNGLFLFNEKAVPQPAYHKTYLLAFGEYTPGVELFPLLAKISPAGTGFGRGQGPTVLDFKGIHLGLQICYESLYPEFTQQLVAKDSEVLINLTNDSWFGPTFEPYQHMYMTLARAIEARRPLIRNTNTGISTAILASGEILQRSPLFSPWSGLFEIPYKSAAESTFYMRYGIQLPWLILIFLILSLAVNRWRGHREKS